MTANIPSNNGQDNRQQKAALERHLTESLPEHANIIVSCNMDTGLITLRSFASQEYPMAAAIDQVQNFLRGYVSEFTEVTIGVRTGSFKIKPEDVQTLIEKMPCEVEQAHDLRMVRSRTVIG